MEKVIWNITIEPTGTGYSCFVSSVMETNKNNIKDLFGKATVGDTVGELAHNFFEVIGHHFEYLKETGEDVSQIDKLELNFVFNDACHHAVAMKDDMRPNNHLSGYHWYLRGIKQAMKERENELNYTVNKTFKSNLELFKLQYNLL